MTTHI